MTQMHAQLKPAFWLTLLGIWAALAGLSPRQAGATSILSIHLIGERLEASDARAVALGGAAQIFPDSLGVLHQNPAMLGFCRKVTIGGNQVVAIDKARSPGYTERHVSAHYPVFMVAFPLTSRLTFGVGYRGRYNPEGSFSMPGVTSSGDAYARTFTKKGGLYAVPLTLAFNIHRHATLGLLYSIERGSMEDRWDVTFEDPEFAPGAGLKREEFSGSGYGVGVVLFPGGRFMLGGTYESEIEYDADIRERFTRPGLDTSYTEIVKVPARMSFASCVRITDSWQMLGSFAYADFTEFDGLSFPEGRLYREESYALGVEYKRGIPLGGKRFPIRFSVNYQRLPYDFPEGERIRKILFGLGTGLHFGGGKCKMDITLRVGKAGSLQKNTVEDRLIRLYVSIAGSEVWKRRGHRRY